MNPSKKHHTSGFTLLETVIAIGVLAVLLSGFMVVFAPAAAGIRKAINSQEASRLVTTVEQELVTLRGSQQTTAYPTGFDKAFEYIKGSAGTDAELGLIVYKYRGSLSEIRDDGTAKPVLDIDGLIPGQDYIVQAMMRRKDDTEFIEDIAAMEGAIYMVKCTQLVMKANAAGDGFSLQEGEVGQILSPDPPNDQVDAAENYQHAVISFVADFYPLPSKSSGFFSNGFEEVFTQTNQPLFSRNLAIRR